MEAKRYVEIHRGLIVHILPDPQISSRWNVVTQDDGICWITSYELTEMLNKGTILLSTERFI